MHHDTDDTSEKATVLSEGSTLPEEALMAMHGGGGSKRARMMVKAAQPVRAVLTRAAIEALETRQALAGPPAQNLRSAPHAEESQQLIMDSFGYQVRRGSATVHREVPSAQKYVQRAVKSGDANDVLLLSCALGWLAEYPGARSVEGMEAESRIDDVVSNARKHFRRRARALAGEVRSILAAQSGSADYAALLRLVAHEGLERFCERETPRDERCTSFMFQLGQQQRCREDSVMRVSFCFVMWMYLREALQGAWAGEEKRLPQLRISMPGETARVCLRARDSDPWRHFDLPDPPCGAVPSSSSSSPWSQATHRGAAGAGGAGSGAGADKGAGWPHEIRGDPEYLRGEGPRYAGVHQPLEPEQWLGVLLERFYAQISPRAGALVPRWLAFMAELDKDVAGSPQGAQGDRGPLALCRCLPFVKRVLSQLTERKLDEAYPAIAAMVRGPLPPPPRPPLPRSFLQLRETERRPLHAQVHGCGTGADSERPGSGRRRATLPRRGRQRRTGRWGRSTHTTTSSTQARPARQAAARQVVARALARLAAVRRGAARRAARAAARPYRRIASCRKCGRRSCGS